MNIGIIDYGSGNIRSVSKSFERAASEIDNKIKINIIDNAKNLRKMDRLVLPGVGAFGDCMNNLRSIEFLNETLTEMVISDSVPFLGICVGMQLLANRSYEHGEHLGFGWISGEVVPIVRNKNFMKIPHMGWNSIKIIKNHSMLTNIKNEEDFYFVHSYKFNCSIKDFLYAKTFYGDPISAILIKDNIVGTQFHPEKSQTFGIQFIKNFIEWVP